MSTSQPIYETANVNKLAYNAFSATEVSLVVSSEAKRTNVTNESKIIMSTTSPSFSTENGDNLVYIPFSGPEICLLALPEAPEQQTQPINRLTKPSKEVEILCRPCNLTFTTHEEFEHHNMELHGHKKLLTCDLCTATFRRADHLKRHVHSMHYNLKYCICPVCGRDLRRQDILLKHIERKHYKTGEIFTCRECSFECKNFKELENHELEHLQTDRHVCEFCQATFKRKDHMLRHVRSQHMNMSISCPVCPQKYKRKDHMVRHVREKHKMGYLNGKLVKSEDVLRKYN